MKNNLTYYQHYCDSHNHWKFKLLRSTLGWSAEGRFWALNNMIANSSGCILKLYNKKIRACVMSELNFTEDEFNNFIKVLTKDCELIINIDGSITTEIVRDNLREVNKQREAARKRKQRLQEGKNNNKENTLSRIFNM